MDPITLIVAALVAGAALGVQDVASAMVKDAYANLKALVKKRLGGGPGAELVLSKHEQAPETWQAPLMAELAQAGADGTVTWSLRRRRCLTWWARLEQGRESIRSMSGGHRAW